jgi:hypothetical protein
VRAPKLASPSRCPSQRICSRHTRGHLKKPLLQRPLRGASPVTGRRAGRPSTSGSCPSSALRHSSMPRAASTPRDLWRNRSGSASRAPAQLRTAAGRRHCLRRFLRGHRRSQGGGGRALMRMARKASASLSSRAQQQRQLQQVRQPSPLQPPKCKCCLRPRLCGLSGRLLALQLALLEAGASQHQQLPQAQRLLRALHLCPCQCLPLQTVLRLSWPRSSSSAPTHPEAPPRLICFHLASWSGGLRTTPSCRCVLSGRRERPSKFAQGSTLPTSPLRSPAFIPLPLLCPPPPPSSPADHALPSRRASHRYPRRSPRCNARSAAPAAIELLVFLLSRRRHARIVHAANTPPLHRLLRFSCIGTL